jgi:hypothetical protein
MASGVVDRSDYKTAGRIELGSDADNIRIDAAAKRIFVGYGSGGLAAIDPSTLQILGLFIRLRAAAERKRAGIVWKRRIS